MRVTERLTSLFIEEDLREVLAEGTSQFLDAQIEDVRRRPGARRGDCELSTRQKKHPEASQM
jgi:hypothetical protein